MLDPPRPGHAAEPQAPATPPPRRQSLVLTVLAVLCFVALVPLVLMGWQVTRSLSTDLEANQKEIQLDKAKTVGEEVARFVAGHFDRLESLASAASHMTAPATRGETDLDAIPFDRMLEDFVGRQGVLQIALVFPREGGDREFAIHAPNFDPESLSADLQPRLAAARERGSRGSRYLSNPFVPVDRPLQSLAVVGVPLRAAGGVSDAAVRRPVLVAVVSMAPVQQIVENIGGLREGYLVYVLDDDRRPFAHTEFVRVLAGEPVQPTELVSERLEPSSAALTFEKAGRDGQLRKVIGAYHPVEIDDHRWGVFVEVDHALGLGQIEDMQRRAVRWGIAAFVLALVIGIMFSWRLTGPIHELIATTRQVERGEYGRRAKVHGNNEITLLADRFNAMTEAIGRTVEDLRVQKELNDHLFFASTRSLAAAIDARDPYTHGHSERVTRFALIIAQQMKLPPAQLRNIEIGALLHDVGKIGIEDRILRKPAALTPEEFEIMKTHPEKGGQIMEPISFIREATEIIIHHHERWDGQGYPSALKAEEIPLGARIVNVADTFDAMTTHRPYQRAMTFAVAARKIGEFSGKACDPMVVKAFLAAFDAGKFGEVAAKKESVETPAAAGRAS